MMDDYKDSVNSGRSEDNIREDILFDFGKSPVPLKKLQQGRVAKNIRNSIPDEATNTLDENKYITRYSNSSKIIGMFVEDKDVCEERMKEYADVNEAKISARNSRIEYIKSLQKCVEKILTFDQKYNDNDSVLESRPNLSNDTLTAMQYEMQCSEGIKYDSYLQVRVEIDALRKAREDYEAWIRRFDKQSHLKMGFCCSRCGLDLKNFIQKNDT